MQRFPDMFFGSTFEKTTSQYFERERRNILQYAARQTAIYQLNAI
jgi:hypothetical protein